MKQPTSLRTTLGSAWLLVLCLWGSSLAAQNINVGLYPTAVADSFEVRAFTDYGTYTGVPSNIVLTIRWDEAAGGTFGALDIANPCPYYSFGPMGPMVTVNGFKYRSMYIIGFEQLTEEYAITTTPRVIVSFRIRGLTGCRRVALVNDQLTYDDNRLYYWSMNGSDRTGAIVTGHYESGPCAPCPPPQIDSIVTTTTVLPNCQLAVNAVVHPMVPSNDHVWELGRSGISDEPSPSFVGSGGRTISLSVSNACGVAVAQHVIEVDSATCPAPVITGIDRDYAGTLGAVELLATFTPSTSCNRSAWQIVEGVIIGESPYLNYTLLESTTLQFTVSNACGFDVLTVDLDLDSATCAPPVILSVDTNVINTALGHFFLQVNLLQGSGPLNVTWSGPIPIAATGTNIELLNAIAGTYQAVVSNPCGSDTISFVIQDVGCSPPVIGSTSHSPFACATDDVSFGVSLSSGTVGTSFTWTGPTELPPLQQFPVVTAPIPGTYQVVATNLCGSDTATLELAIACTPPEVLEIIAGPVQCASGEQILFAQLTPGVSCPSFAWSGPDGVSGNGQSFTVGTNGSGSYQVVVTNACGSDTASYQVVSACVPPVITNVVHSPWDCPTSPVYILTHLAPGATCPTLTWSGPAQPIGSGVSATLLSGTALPGTYQVVASNACGSDSATMVLAIDSTACTPPVITSLEHSSWHCGTDHMYFQVFWSGTSCAQYQWTGPTAIEGTNHKVYVGDPTGGTYQVVVTNLCGSDTATVIFQPDTAACAPVIANVTHYGWNWAMEPVWMQAELANYAGEVNYEWSGPSPLMIDAAMTYSTAALPGSYMVVAYNDYGRDTAYYTLHTSLPCMPPSIASITAPDHACAGGDLTLGTTVLGADSGLYVHWSGPPNTLMLHDALTTDVLFASTGTYTVQVANGCGTALASHHVTIIDADPASVTLCGNSSPHDLSLHLGTHAPGGSWTANGQPHTGVYDPALDIPGEFLFHDGSGANCADVPVLVTELPVLMSGTDASVSICSSAAAQDLLAFLGGTPDQGGMWSFNDEPFSGPFDPAMHSPGIYRYMHEECGDAPATLLVDVQPAQAWYEDLDGDGLGDDNTLVWACTPPVGSTAQAGDDCPLQVGVIGSPCDDGLAWTVEDVVQADCNCLGEAVLGLTAEEGQGSLVLWPQPSNGSALFLNYSGLNGAPVDVLVRDAAGRTLLLEHRTVEPSGTLQLNFRTPLSSGTYFLELTTRSGRLTQRFVVER